MWVLRRLRLLLVLALLSGPIIAPGPCASESEWGCYPFRVWMPLVGGL